MTSSRQRFRAKTRSMKFSRKPGSLSRPSSSHGSVGKARVKARAKSPEVYWLVALPSSV